MIDLSHLTEEEQGAIMTVLRRDAELKKAEEQRISNLEKIITSGSKMDSKWKYLSGEWFYEAKSRRHTDKIHGSEIILASMKQKKAALDGSLRVERAKTASSRGSDISPPKPARCLEAVQPQEINNAEKENVNSGARSPRMARHNPFNRASLIIVEPPENNIDTSILEMESSEIVFSSEPMSPRKSNAAGETSQMGSTTSETSSAGFRPVPKKRTFVSKRSSSQSDSSGLGLDAQAGSARIVPSPRRSLRQGSSGSSNQSSLKGQDEMPQKYIVSHQVVQSAQPSKSIDENSQQPLCDVSQESSNFSPKRERNQPSLARDRSVDDSSNDSHPISKLPHPSTPANHISRPAMSTRSDASAHKEIPQKSNPQNYETQREGAVFNTAILQAGSVQDSDRGDRVGTAMKQEELSLPQSTVDADPPVSYDLKFVDKSDQQTKKSNPKHAFRLSTHTTSPTGDEDSIAKVLDWFSRSTDSSDWLNTEDGQEATQSSDTDTNISKLKVGDSSKEAGDIISNSKKEALEIKGCHPQKQANVRKELIATDRTGNIGQTETQEVTKDARDKMRSQEFEDNDNESQTAQISHLRSFWEKSRTGPKILIGKSITASDKGQLPANLSVEKDEKKVNKPNSLSDTPSVLGIDNGKGSSADAREQLVIRSQKVTRDTGDPQEAERRGSDTEILSVTRLSQQPWPAIQSRQASASESVSLGEPNPQPESISLSKELRDGLPKTIAMSQLDTVFQTRDSPDSEKVYLSRNSPHLDCKQGDVEITSKTQIHRSPSEDVNRSKDKNMQSSMSPKRKNDTLTKDRINSPRLSRKGLPHQDSTAERIKQLKSFWEQERKPMFYTGKSKTLGDGKVGRGANQAKLNKRFTKSEYDLRSIGDHSSSDEEDYERNYQHITVLPLNQRIEKSPILGTSRTQFNTLREFWDDTSLDTKASLSYEKPKSPKRRDPLSTQAQSQDLKCGDPEKSRPNAMKSSPAPQNRSRPVTDSKISLSNYTISEQQRESKRSSKDSNKEEKSTKPKCSSGKEIHSPKTRKDSFSISSSRGHSLRRATSMFALSVPDENDQSQLEIDVSPIHSQSRKQRQNTEKGSIQRRSAEETETLTPRARSCVPRDYRHYLGMTDKTSVHKSLAPALEDNGSEGKSGYEFDLAGPMRASTPVSSEERYSRKGSKMSQRPLWTSYSSSDTGQESSVSSTSETWSNLRNTSNRENVDDCQNLVRKALRRAEARPKNLAKSMEDITAPLSPRQERRQDPTADMRHLSDVSSIPSPSSSLFSDPDHLKKMSKSVPLFLQKEDAGIDTDSIWEDNYPNRRLMMGNSLTNLTSSSGMASLSGSVMTMDSGDFGNVEVQGNIQFSINYIQKLREFHIFVSECRDLAAVDPKRGRSDPYVKSYLVPDKANLGKRKTSVKKKTLNPTFNEILRYRVRMEYLRTQMLILSVWHHDTFGRNSFLGEVDVDLSKWDFNHTQMNYLTLKARTTPTVAPSNDRGEMRIAVRFLPEVIHSEGVTKEGPNTGEIHIWVKECKNLPPIRATIDPYVKCFVLPDTSRKSRQKTRVLRRTVDPMFNHTMVYDGIREADLAEACVELTVWDRDRLASNLLGGVRLGLGTGRSYGAMVDWMDSTPYEVVLWERMKSSPNEWVEDVLPIRVLNSAKTAFK